MYKKLPAVNINYIKPPNMTYDIYAPFKVWSMLNPVVRGGVRIIFIFIINFFFCGGGGEFFLLGKVSTHTYASPSPSALQLVIVIKKIIKNDI